MAVHGMAPDEAAGVGVAPDLHPPASAVPPHRGSGVRALRHTPQIDGLRALAVLAVFVFHNTESALPGGFLGVDLFFVLSGYLITRLLIVEVDQTSKVALLRFYGRRVRRLLPASLCVMLAIVAWTYVSAAPSALVPTRDDVTSALAYVANWRFIFTDVDYFGSTGTVSPLRHFWSLAVEEQFYFVWPLVVGLILYASRKWNPYRALLLFTGFAIVVSLAAFVVLRDPVAPTRAYFGTDTRAHQLLIGAFVGILQARGLLNFGRYRTAVQLVGLAVFSALAITMEGTSSAYFWGGSAGVAFVFAVLIAATVEPGGNLIDRSLNSAPSLGLGKISYAFYLWHWPIILWLPYAQGAGFIERRIVDSSRFAVTLALSTASYHLFENAVRRGRMPWVGSVNWRTLTGAALASVTLLAINLYLLTPSSGDVVAFSASDTSVEYCPDEPTPCEFHQASGDRPLVVTMGDSTSQQYTPALVQLARQYDFTYVQAGSGGCPFDRRNLAKGPGDGEDRFIKFDLRCQEWESSIFEEVVAMDPSLILVADGQMGFRHVDSEGEFVLPGTAAHVEDVLSGTRDSIREVTEGGATVVLIEPLPTLPNTDCLADNQATPEACGTEADLSSLRPYLDGWKTIANGSNGTVKYVSLLSELCPGGDTCPAILDGIVASYDGRHLTRSMSIRIAPALGQALKSAGVDLAALD